MPQDLYNKCKEVVKKTFENQQNRSNSKKKIPCKLLSPSPILAIRWFFGASVTFFMKKKGALWSIDLCLQMFANASHNFSSWCFKIFYTCLLFLSHKILQVFFPIRVFLKTKQNWQS